MKPYHRNTGLKETVTKCFPKAKLFPGHSVRGIRRVAKKERKGLSPVEELKPTEDLGQTPSGYSSLTKPFLFTIAVGQ